MRKIFNIFDNISVALVENGIHSDNMLVAYISSLALPVWFTAMIIPVLICRLYDFIASKVSDS